MKTITAFAVFVIIPYILYAQNDTYSLSAAFQSGVLYGQAEEIVYSDPNFFPLRTTNDKLSQLLWDMKPVFYYGIILDYAPIDPFANWGLFAALGIKTAVPEQKSGVMEDRDWDSKVNNDLTHFSRHDTITNDFSEIEIKIGSSFPLHANWLVAAYTAVLYNRFGFSGNDGQGTYARGKEWDSNNYYPIDDNPIKYTFSGTVISYSQEWLTIVPGISLAGRFFSVLSAEAFFQISPLIFCNDLDKHVGRREQFMDVMNGGLSMETGVSLTWTARQWFSLAIETSYRHIKGTRGVTYWRGLGSDDDFSEVDEYFSEIGEAGAGLVLFDSRILIKVRF